MTSPGSSPPPSDTPAGAGAKAHVVLDELGVDSDALLAMPDDVTHHLTHVLRLRLGDAVTATDGRGAWRAARLAGGALDVTGPVQHVARRAPSVGVAFALTKGDKPELVVQKLTEIGVDRIVPFVAERSIVAWDGAKAERNVARWRVVAREALRQSRQAWMPEVADVCTFADLCRAPAGVARADLGGDAPDGERHRLVLIGPEGGWSPSERTALPAAVQLGSSVLRAETAAIVAGTLLVAIRSGLVNVVR